jgi:anti-sigma regulatory factor (Ser/Thr protein kinase)
MNEERKREYIRVVPSARRLINSLRNMRYDFVKAVADIVDNSIQAGATKVDIVMKFEGKDSWIRIADNGKGMNVQEITEAMRLGTRRDYAEGELGKFGLGMKLASLSQCRRLTVASRSAVAGSDIVVMILDLDDIEDSDEWEITKFPPSEVSPKIIEPINDNSGTVIFWEHLDRMMRYRIPSGTAANKKFNDMARELELHLSMVFNMFLSGEVESKKIQITLNRNAIKPWDPFARSERATYRFEEGVLPVQGKEKVYQVKYSAYILPTQELFSSREAFDYYGRGQWNELQGFYFYRENRLIQYGGWNNFRRLDEHIKFARVGIYFDSTADGELDMDVKKSDINIPVNLREALSPIIKRVTAMAEGMYRSVTPIPVPQKPEETLPSDESSNTTEYNYPKEIEQQPAPLPESEDRKIEKTQNSETEEPEESLRDTFKKLTKLINSNEYTQNITNSMMNVIIETLKKLYLASFRLSAEKLGELNTLEKIKEKIRSDFPDIASFLEL